MSRFSEAAAQFTLVALLFALLALAILRTPLPGPASPVETRAIALDLLNVYGFPLVLVGLILAVAMMAGVALAKEDK